MQAIRAGGAAKPDTLGPRIAMLAFVASEVLFFSAFFAAYFYYAGDPEVAGLTAWPPAAARPLDAWGGPLLNTALLLSSGAAVAIAHQAMLTGRKESTQLCLGAAIALGLGFLVLQGREYWLSHLHYGDGVYPSLFFLTTGFHGVHVVVGLAMLAVSLARVRDGRLDPQRQFGFEASVWYWHFVDAVWLVLFAVLYVQIW
jgi:cytochrome c oxidase subunit 3